MSLSKQGEWCHLDNTLPDGIPPITWPQWVTAYNTNRSYGGSEEGGWWFDTGEVLASIPCYTEDQIEIAKGTLKRLYGPQFEGNHDIGSVLCEGRLLIVVEDEQGEDYPKENPHYE